MTDDAPKRIWVSAPNEDNEVETWTDPDEGGTEYILASEVDALVAAALEPVMNLLMEPVATHTDSDWLGLRHDLLVQVTSAPAAAALDKLIREAEARGMERAARIAWESEDVYGARNMHDMAKCARNIAAAIRSEATK